MYLRALRTCTACLLACAPWVQGCGASETASGDASTADATPPGEATPDAAEPESGAGADGGGGEAGTEGETGTGGAARPHLVFATSSEHTGALGGPAGADAICAARAQEAGLEGDFIAWLSVAHSEARGRLEDVAGSFIRTDGTALANDLEDLLDGELAAPIDHDELGRPVTGDAWTGSLSDGRAVTDLHCQGFTSGSIVDTGLCGSTQASDERWSAAQEPSCDAPLRLYCFQR